MHVVLPTGGAHRTFDGLFLDIRFDFFFQKKIRLLLWQKRLWWSRGVTSLGGWCSQMLISVSVCVNVRMRARARACVCVCVQELLRACYALAMRVQPQAQVYMPSGA